jgi:hypothetical protein
VTDDRDTQTDQTPPGDPDSGDSSTDVLSDLLVNVVPIGIILVFLFVFTVLSPLGGDGGDPLVLFHGALIGGVVLVSAVAGWVIRQEDAPLQGSAARDDPIQSGGDDTTPSTADDSTQSDSTDSSN